VFQDKYHTILKQHGWGGGGKRLPKNWEEREKAYNDLMRMMGQKVMAGRVLHCVAACCSVLQCVAVCCSVLQRVALCCSVLQCDAVCCSVLQCVAACCNVLQCVLVCVAV